MREHVAASGRFPEEHLADLPPRNGRCTVEKLAVNAVMAGAPAAAMPLLCAAVEAMSEPDFNLFALNTTTSCVVPGVFVNGPIRHELEIPFEAGCFGGVAGPAPAIGRALRLLMRNVGGQVVGLSSKSVFGQPGRVDRHRGRRVGGALAVGAARANGAASTPGADASTVHGCTGTIDIADIVADNGADLLEVIGKSLAFCGTNAFIGAHHGAEILVCLPPPWAELIAASFPTVEAVQAELQRHAALPIDWWPMPHRAKAERDGRVDDAGMVHLVADPDHMLVMVNGGLGNLHALALHSFGPTRAVTRALRP